MSSNKTRSLFIDPEGIAVFYNKVISGSTSVDILFTSSTMLFIGVVKLYLCSVRIL
ncbi:hypothetical protein MKW92_025936 [Papaver armeniacum]|nr:hypothetical protein MKW92_025936 [Papaver armeniacum]